MSTNYSKLKRPRYPMPASVEQALAERGLMKAYKARPAYQQNDYIGWISRESVKIPRRNGSNRCFTNSKPAASI